MAGEEGLQTDEKVLIIASAVLGTILVSLLCFAALYKSFLAQYASAYDNHIKMLNPFSADMAGRQDSAAALEPVTTGLNQVQIKLASSPSNADFDVVQGMPNPHPQAAVASPTIAETSFADPKPTSPPVGHGSTTPAWGSPSAEIDEGEFFSADEQARIWAELREAEDNAAGSGDSVNAARAAAASAASPPSGTPGQSRSPGTRSPVTGETEYADTFASTASIGIAQAVTVHATNAGADSDSDSDDANTKFGFDEADLNMSGMSSNGGTPAQATSPDYIDGDGLEATGVTFSGPASPMGVNADNEWWK